MPKKAVDPSLVERAKDKWEDRLRKYRRILADGKQTYEVREGSSRKKETSD